MDAHGLYCLNTPGTPTWFGSQETTCPSVLNLTLVNEAAIFGGQLGELTVSRSESLGSDHAALLLNFFSNEGTTMPRLPAPNGYRADEQHRDAWTKAFTLQYIATNNVSVQAGAGPASAHYPTPRAEANAFRDLVHNVSSPLVATPPRWQELVA